MMHLVQVLSALALEEQLLACYSQKLLLQRSYRVLEQLT
jgi:hypothetical protein